MFLWLKLLVFGVAFLGQDAFLKGRSQTDLSFSHFDSSISSVDVQPVKSFSKCRNTILVQKSECNCMQWCKNHGQEDWCIMY